MENFTHFLGYCRLNWNSENCSDAQAEKLMLWVLGISK